MELVLRTIGFGGGLVHTLYVKRHHARYGQGSYVGAINSSPIGNSPMDEAATLRFLGWTVGGVIGVVFVLNAIALSFI
jgi:hypothetical protein